MIWWAYEEYHVHGNTFEGNLGTPLRLGNGNYQIYDNAFESNQGAQAGAIDIRGESKDAPLQVQGNNIRNNEGSMAGGIYFHRRSHNEDDQFLFRVDTGCGSLSEVTVGACDLDITVVRA